MKEENLYFYSGEIPFDLLDAGNVVHHPNYLVLCERARNELLIEWGYSFREMIAEGFALAVVDLHCKFIRALQFYDKYEITTRVLEVGKASIALEQKIFRTNSERTLSFDMNLKLACVSLNPVRSARFPDKLEKALENISLAR